MNVEKTHWPVDGYDDPEMRREFGYLSNVDMKTKFDYTSDLVQPGFGIEISWNQPKFWWKLYLVVNVWHWRIQIGWLY